MDIEKVDIRLVVGQCGGLLTSLDSIWSFINNICKDLKDAHESNMPTCHMYVMLIGNYGRHMAFTTDLPFCLAYPTEHYNMKDPLTMMIHNPENHPAATLANDMVVCQLLALNNLDPNYTRTSHGRRLLIPRDMHFGNRLFPEIVTLQNHAAPYIDPTTGMEAPFMSVGTFRTSDPLFMGIARDCQLYTSQDVPRLKMQGSKSPSDTRLLDLLHTFIIRKLLEPSLSCHGKQCITGEIH